MCPNIEHCIFTYEYIYSLQSAEDASSNTGEDNYSSYSSRKNSLGLPASDTRPQT
jgi:hypothetical protein